MADSVPVRCPACRREHAFTPKTYPCACGATLSVPVLRGGVPTRVSQRLWQDSWVSLRCPACGRTDDWPRPELACGCGTVIRLPVDHRAATASARPTAPVAPAAPPEAAPATTPPEAVPAPATPPAPPPPAVPRPVRRPLFEPVTIRTRQDAVSAAAAYLRWLGFADVGVVTGEPAGGAELRAPGLLVRVDPTTLATQLRDIETLWLTGLGADAATVCFSLAGYAADARERADGLGIPLFVLDLTGTPQPVNDAAHTLIRTAPRLPGAGTGSGTGTVGG